MKNHDYWAERLANEIWTVYNDTEKYHWELVRAHQKARDTILQELQAIALKDEKNGKISRSEFYRADHLRRMEKTIVSELRGLGENIETRGKDYILHAGEDVVAKTGEALGIPLNYDRRFAERMLQVPWHKATFSQRIWKNQDNLRQRLNNDVAQGVMTGRSGVEIARDLSKSMDVGLSNSLRLVRTETMHHANQVNMQSMKDSGVVKQVKEVVTLDERTSSECAPHDGKIWDIDDAPILPRHPNCRCVLVPYIDVKKVAEEFEKREAELYVTGRGNKNRELKRKLSRISKANSINTLEKLGKISKSDIINMKDFTDIQTYLSETYNVKVTNFGKQSLEVQKVVLSAVDDMLTRFPEISETFREIVYNHRRKVAGVTSGHVVTLGKRGLNYETVVHELTHELDRARGGDSLSYSSEVVTKAIKNLKLRKNSRKVRNYRLEIVGVDGIEVEKDYEVVAYSAETEFVDSTKGNPLSKEIWRLLCSGTKT